MPDISLFKTARISERVNTANVAQGGATWSAISRLGAQGEDLALNMFEKQKKVQSDTYVINSGLEYERELQATSEELKKKHGTNYEALATDMKDKGEQLRQKYLDAAPYDQARNSFSAESQSRLGREMITTDQYIRKSVTEQGIKSKDNMVSAKAQEFYNDPNHLERDVNFKKAIAEVRDKDLFTPDEMDRLEADATQKMRRGTVDGFFSKASKLGVDNKIDKEQDMYKKGLEFLNSDNPMLKGMTPDERLSYESKFEAGMRQAQERQKNHTSQQVSMYVNSGLQDDKLYADLLNQVRNNPSFDKFEKDTMVSQLMTQNAYQKANSALGLVPPSERDTDKFVKTTVASMGITDPLVKASTEAKLAGAVKQRMAQDEVEMKKSPASYFAQRDGNVAILSKEVMSGNPASYAKLKTELDSHYDRFGIPKSQREYVTPELKGHIKNTFEKSIGMRDYDTASKVLNDVENMSSRDSYAILKQSGVPEKFAVLGDIPDNNNRIQMLRSLNEYKENKDLANAKGVGAKDLNDFKEKVAKDPFFQAMNRSGGGYGKQKAAAYLELAEANYLSKVAQTGEAPEATSLTNIFGKMENTSAARSNVNYPKNIPSSQVEGFIDHYSSGDLDYVDNLNLELMEGETKESMNESLSQKGEWVNTLDNSGVELWARNRMNVLAPVIKYEKNGAKSHVTFKWDEVAKFQAPAKQRVALSNEDTKNRWKNIWRGKM